MGEEVIAWCLDIAIMLMHAMLQRRKPHRKLSALTSRTELLAESKTDERELDAFSSTVFDKI